MKNKDQLHSSPIPVRLDPKQMNVLQRFQDETGLNKSFIIRRCITYALQKFVEEKVDVLSLHEKK